MEGRFSQLQPWTVDELSQYIKDLLEFAPELQDVWLVGELSNLTRAASGHPDRRPPRQHK